MDKAEVKKIQKALMVEGLLWLSLPSFILLMGLLLTSAENKNLRMTLYIILGIVIVVANARIILKARSLVADVKDPDDKSQEGK